MVQNMQHVLASASPACRPIVVDRFYTSVALFLQLLAMKLYAIRTIRMNSIGYNKTVFDPRKTRTQNGTRGEFKMSRSVDAPAMLPLSWMDSWPVLFPGTGASGTRSTVNRRRGAEVESVPYPMLVRDYHDLMGEMDRHVQLRLQRYSVQLTNWFGKYYVSLFFGLVDLTVVN